ncbi:hypothetical protein [Candidatus Mycoplasma haematohominis]|uniref:Uncharacterized protein n=1 Tax=Candidatus Mycoplasma haematohominis TaxID=1494318 RepID=A0A478FQB2_9MOLU|nr:hypothetical protein [Candidatus Mycoplasma haemohominis]GCE63661.1 hypothetical protein MHSWG343_06610 [Candidatus Mycoplasma haemohominis]
MDLPKKIEIKSAKAQKIIVTLEELFDPDLAGSVEIRDRFHAKLKIEADACKLKAIEEGFMPLAHYCDFWTPRGGKAFLMQTPSHISALKGVKVICLVDSAIWAVFEDVRKDFQIGNTVKFVGAWGRIYEYQKRKEKFFVFSLLPLETYN